MLRLFDWLGIGLNFAISKVWGRATGNFEAEGKGREKFLFSICIGAGRCAVIDTLSVLDIMGLACGCM